MKVKKKGTLNWKSDVTCKGCKAELEIEGTDLQYVISDEAALAQQYRKEVTGEFFVWCPECGQRLTVKNIPPAIQTQVMGE